MRRRTRSVSFTSATHERSTDVLVAISEVWTDHGCTERGKDYPDVSTRPSLPAASTWPVRPTFVLDDVVADEADVAEEHVVVGAAVGLALLLVVTVPQERLLALGADKVLPGEERSVGKWVRTPA